MKGLSWNVAIYRKVGRKKKNKEGSPSGDGVVIKSEEVEVVVMWVQ